LISSSFSDSSKDPDLEIWKNITEKVSDAVEEPTKKRFAAAAAARATKVKRSMGSRDALKMEWDQEE